MGLSAARRRVVFWQHLGVEHSDERAGPVLAAKRLQSGDEGLDGPPEQHCPDSDRETVERRQIEVGVHREVDEHRRPQHHRHDQQRRDAVAVP